MKQTKHIAVIGAGLSGLTAALALEAAGHEVTVFEKSRGAGGRLSTRRTRDAALPAWQCDHGAPSFVARTDAFASEMEAWREDGCVERWSPRGTTQAMWVGTPSMNAPAQRLAKRLKQPIHASHTVDALHKIDEGWQLRTAEHGAISTSFNSIVLAIPSVQTAKLLATIEGTQHQNASNPSVQTFLSPFLTRARASRMHATWAMMCRFDAPISLDRDWIEVNTGALSLAVRDSAKLGRTHSETWALHASAAWSDANVEAKPEDVASALLEAFVAVGGTASTDYDVHRWRYSQTARDHANGAQPLATQFEWSSALALGLCGDWVAQTARDFSHVDGVEAAWLSGRGLADAMLRANA